MVLVYLDPAQERLDRAHDAAFESAVEAARMGYIFAHDRRAYGRWAQRVSARRPSRSLSPAQLEVAVMQVMSTFPDNVTRGTMPARVH